MKLDNLNFFDINWRSHNDTSATCFSIHIKDEYYSSKAVKQDNLRTLLQAAKSMESTLT